MKQDQKPQVLPPKYNFGKTYMVRVRQHEGDAFPGLWDCDIMGAKGEVVLKSISQADQLNICVENLQGELENDGY